MTPIIHAVMEDELRQIKVHLLEEQHRRKEAERRRDEEQQA